MFRRVQTWLKKVGDWFRGALGRRAEPMMPPPSKPPVRAAAPATPRPRTPPAPAAEVVRARPSKAAAAENEARNVEAPKTVPDSAPVSLVASAVDTLAPVEAPPREPAAVVASARPEPAPVAAAPPSVAEGPAAPPVWSYCEACGHMVAVDANGRRTACGH